MLVEPQETTDLLCRWAREAGFDRAGVAILGTVDTGRPFIEWLAAGRHAGMGYLARRIEVRLDTRNVFQGARSALCVALQYSSGEEPAEPLDELWMGIARYARGRDYHDLMGKRLAALGRRIEEEFPGAKTRWYVDTGPVLERDLAAAAGLGAVGKNTCLLHPESGSWFFVGEIFTSLTLAPRGASPADLCASCTSCLDACPTGALPRPYELDANRCISYWTIEHRGVIPQAVRPLLGQWIFGCDVCQEVCPHNEGPLTAVESPLELAGARSELTIDQVLDLEPDGYREVFRGSPVKRARLSGLKRNTVIAMGNSGRRRWLGPLALALETGDAELRSHAAWALGRIGGNRAEQALEAALAREESSAARLEIETAMEACRLRS